MGASWQIMSPDLTTNDPANGSRQLWRLSKDNSGMKTIRRFSPLQSQTTDENVIWVGTDDGNVQVTQDGGKSNGTIRSQIFRAFLQIHGATILN